MEYDLRELDRCIRRSVGLLFLIRILEPRSIIVMIVQSDKYENENGKESELVTQIKNKWL